MGAQLATFKFRIGKSTMLINRSFDVKRENTTQAKRNTPVHSRMLLPIRKMALSCVVVASVLYFSLCWKLWFAVDKSAKRASPLRYKSSRSYSGSNNNVDSDAPLRPRNDTPGSGWIFEPVNLRFFWTLTDRRFMSGIYPHLRQFHRVLDVGARGYNQECKGLINSTTTEYYQVEPFPPDVMNNDGLLQCKVHEIPALYPQYKTFFDVVLDFGVFGWRGTHQFNTTKEFEDDIRAYISGILFLLKPKGLWILKVDRKWVPDEDYVFNEFILPHFDIGDFEDYKSGIKVKKFRFFFLHHKGNTTSDNGHE